MLRTTGWSRRGGWLVFAAGVLIVIARSIAVDDVSQSHAVTPAREVTVTAVFVDVPRHSAFGSTLVARLTDPIFPRNIQLFIPNHVLAQDWAQKVCWHLRLRVTGLRPARNPGVTDRAMRLKQRGIGATATVLPAPHNRPCAFQPRFSGMLIRQAVQQQVNATIDDNDARAVLHALTTGDRQYMSAPLRQLLTQTGTAHLMAISGLHVGLVAGGMFALVRWFIGGRVRVASDYAAIAGIVAALVYSSLAGDALSTRRAIAMLIAGACLMRARIPIDLVRLTLLTIAVFAVVRTEEIRSTAFILSFGAVFVLGLAQRRRAALLCRGRSGVRATIGAQCLLSLISMPLIAGLFGHVSVISIVANIIVVPIFGLIVIPLALAGVVALSVSADVAAALWQLAMQITTLTLAGLTEVSGFIPTSIETRGVTMWAAFAGCALIVAAVLFAGMPGRVLMILALPSVLMPRVADIPIGCASAWMLNVGHGTAVVLGAADQRYLYDTGPKWRGGGDAATTIVMPYLRRHWSRDVARAIVSHSDDDHDGGVASLRESGVVARWLGVGDIPCVAGQAWQRGGIRFTVLWPVHDVGASPWGDNDSSCVLRVSAGEDALLLLGDVEGLAERELVSLGGIRAHISNMPHHGSRTSSSSALIQAVGARDVVASAGLRRGWLLPHPDVSARWTNSGARIFVTARLGAIPLMVCTDHAQGVTGVASH